MKNATVILSPEVDAAILRLIDFVDVSEIPDVIAFLESAQNRMVRLLSDFPESGPWFQGRVRFLPVDGCTYLCEYHAETNEVHVLDLMMPGQNWR